MSRGIVSGVARYGGPRPDVANDYPHAPADIGYSYSLDTTRYPNGAHVLSAQVTDTSGNVATLPGVAVSVSNQQCRRPDTRFSPVPG